MIELKNISYKYESAPFAALNGVSLNILKGEMLAIVGHNGSGKSTLAKHLNGLLLPTSGDVLVNGVSTKDAGKLLSIRQNVGMVFQNPDNQLVTTIVEEDVAFGPESLGVPPDEILKRVNESLESVNMRAYAKSAPHMLSGGQKQRVAIAGMLAMRPQVLVLDESTAMLDPEGRREIWKVIRSLKRDMHMTVVVITQLMEEAALCDRVAVLYHGKLELLGTPRQLFMDSKRLEALGLAPPGPVRIRDALIDARVPIPGGLISIEDIADAIAKIYEQKRSARDGNK